MKKNRILSIGIILAIAIIIVLITIFILNKRTIIDIQMKDNGEQKTLYKLKIKKNGEYKLIIENTLNEETEGPAETTYKEKLTDLELEKINTIIKYVKEKSNIKESKAFKYNYEKDKEYDQETIGILENMIIAVENISMDEIKIGETSRREFGNTMLDNIISTQL